MDPYIGVTGFTTPEEVRAALETFPHGAGRKLMVGVLASGKTLRGIPLKPHWAPRYPPVEAIAPLLLDDPRVLNLVHYSTDANQPSQLFDELVRIREYAGANLHGFQLNIPWPNSTVLEMLQTRELLCLVLQMGPAVMEEFRTHPASALRRIQRYDGAIDSVLIDPSGGKSLPLDPEIARTVLHLLQAPGLGLGVAGGLGPDSLHLVEPLLSEFPDVSIDAEGLLRTLGGGLDPTRVRRYLTNALALFDPENLKRLHRS